MANGQLMDSLTELTQCRLTVKNLAWSEHWVAVFWQALVREGYEMTVPLTFGLAFWGDRLGMPAARRAAYVYGLPCVFALFVLLWHAGLGQPAVLRSSAPGTAVFYTILGCCALEVALRVRRMLPDRPASAVYFVLFVFGFAVVFPDYVYSFLVLPLCFGGNVPGARRLAVRMLLHPFICELSLAAIRNFCRHLGAAQGREGLAAILLVAAHVVKSVFGRFLISQAR